MRKYLLTIGFIFLMLGIKAEEPFAEQFNISYLNMRTGLPSNYIFDIHTDSYGFVWISTKGGGLVKYDGYSFFSPNMMNMGYTMRSNSCRSIAEDKHHRLWVAYEEGIDIIDLNTMRNVVIDDKDPLYQLLKQPTLRTYCDKQGNIWIVTRTYIYYIQIDQEGKTSPPLSYAHRMNAPDACIYDFEGNGSVWTATNGGIYRLNVQNNKLIRTSIAPALDHIEANYISDMLLDGDLLWISSDLGLYKYNHQNQVLSVYKKETNAHSVSHSTSTCLAMTSDKRLIIGTLGGLNIYNSQNDSFERWTAASHLPLSSDFVSCLMTHDHQIWIGTETGGIIKLTPTELRLKNFVSTSDPGSISPNPVNAMLYDSQGNFWAGTVEGGLNLRSKDKKTFHHFTTTNSNISHNSVSTLAEDNLHRLWIGTWGKGINICNINNPSQITQLSIPETYQQLTMNVGALCYDSINHGMWIGCNDGLYLYNFNTKKMEEPVEGCRNIRGCIGSIIDKQNHLWVGSGEGVVCISLKEHDNKGQYKARRLRYRLDDPESKVIEIINSFCVDRKGDLWLGSNEYGLYHRTVDGKGMEHFERYTMQQGLPHNAVKGIVEDKQGMLWITTINGLSRFNPKTKTFYNYNEEDGLISSQFYWNSAIMGADGHIYLGSDKGLSELIGFNVSGKPLASLKFTRLVVDNQNVTSMDQFLDQDISQAKIIHLHESNKSFAIDFSALDYGNNHNGLYSYRLKGFDDGWIQLPVGEHNAHFTGLSAGDYTLEVKYTSASNVTEDLTASIKISVKPYFWKTWWFIGTLAILISFFLAKWYKYRMQRIAKRIKKEEEKRLIAPIEKIMRESNNPEELAERIQSILHIQNKFKESATKSATTATEEIGLQSLPFMEKVMKILELNYKNSDFGVQELCDALGMSRPNLSKRLNKEVGQPANQFIRNYRLDIARQMLLNNPNEQNIADIAFNVGFNDPKYFTRCFTKVYGYNPSSFATNNQKTIVEEHFAGKD